VNLLFDVFATDDREEHRRVVGVMKAAMGAEVAK